MSPQYNKRVSIVLPVYNEADNLNMFYSQLVAVIDTLPQYDFEFIFVNDGSSDNSEHIIKNISQKDTRVKWVGFTRNFGHQAALKCGLKLSTGDAVITMDTDLQHPPSLIPDMIKSWESGYEIVNTFRMDAQSSGFLKKISSRLFYKIFNHLSDIKISNAGADFRLLSREVTDIINRELNEKNIFLRGLIAWIGGKQSQLTYHAQPRHTGESKYTIKKMFSFANNGLSYFTLIPIKLGLYLGVILFSTSFLYLFISIIYGIYSGTLIKGWTSLIFIFLLISSIQFVFIGILGIYIGHIFTEVKNRPTYIIKSKEGFSD